MGTDVHFALDTSNGLGGHRLFWTLVVIAILAAVVSPFMPPRALADTTQDLQ